MAARRINGFSASILVDGVALNTSGIIIDRTERMMESYIQARGGQPFTVAWGCKETDLASRGDVFVDGVWVGYACIDPTTSLHGEGPGRAETSKAGELAASTRLPTNTYAAQLASEGWVRQGETAPRQFAFDADALRKVEEAEMAASAGFGGAGAEGFGETGRGEIQAPRTIMDEGRTNGGAGEVRLVISRLGRPRMPGNNLDEDVAMGTSSKPRANNVVLEKLATFTFKYRSKEFLSKMAIFQRPCLDMDRIHEKNTLNEILSETLQDPQVQSANVGMNFDETNSQGKTGKGKAELHRSQKLKATLKRYREAERHVLAAQKRERRERGIVARAAKREAYAASLAQAQEQVTRKREKAKEVQAMSMDVDVDVDEDDDLETEKVEGQDESSFETEKVSRKTRRTFRVNGLRPRSRMIHRKDKIEQAQRIKEDMTVL